MEVFSTFMKEVDKTRANPRDAVTWANNTACCAVPEGVARLTDPTAQEAVGNILGILLQTKPATTDAWRTWAKGAPRGRRAQDLFTRMLAMLATLHPESVVLTLQTTGASGADMTHRLQQAAVAGGAVAWTLCRAVADLCRGVGSAEGALHPRDAAVFRLARLGGASTFVTEGEKRGDDASSLLRRLVTAFLKDEPSRDSKSGGKTSGKQWESNPSSSTTSDSANQLRSPLD